MFTIPIRKESLYKIRAWLVENVAYLIAFTLSIISIFVFYYYYNNDLGLSYNDARSHLDIGRRVVENLKPGLAQLGSVWLPLPHALMVPTIWNDYFWHSGLSGALISMISFVATGIVIFEFLKNLGVGTFGRLFGVFVFAANLNILYLTSTAMTELLLLATMTAGAYYLMLWARTEHFLNLIKSAFFIMLSTLTRYDGWFLLFYSTIIVFYTAFRKKGYKIAEGNVVMFVTLGAFGIVLWLLWNLLIFKDPFYFAFGPFSAHAQQEQLLAAGELPTKHNLFLSTKVYLFAFVFNSYAFPAILFVLGFIAFLRSKITWDVKLASTALLAPLIFNILALYLGHSVLFVQGISGKTWFNVRYGIMLAPAVAVFCGYLLHRFKDFRLTILGLYMFTIFFAFTSGDAVTIDDARVGSSQKNVTEVSGWLNRNAKEKDGFVLISAASHDAVIFSSGLPMKKFIHEGTGKYWGNAVKEPDRWARWMVMRTHDNNDLSWKNVSVSGRLDRYKLVESYPFADIYELKDEYLKDLITTPILGKQK